MVKGTGVWGYGVPNMGTYHFIYLLELFDLVKLRRCERLGAPELRCVTGHGGSKFWFFVPQLEVKKKILSEGIWNHVGSISTTEKKPMQKLVSLRGHVRHVHVQDLTANLESKVCGPYCWSQPGPNAIFFVIPWWTWRGFLRLCQVGTCTGATIHTKSLGVTVCESAWWLFEDSLNEFHCISDV